MWDYSRLDWAATECNLPDGWERPSWAWPDGLPPLADLCPGSSARRSPPGCNHSWRGWRAGATTHHLDTNGSAGRNPLQKSSHTGQPRQLSSEDPRKKNRKSDHKDVEVTNINSCLYNHWLKTQVQISRTHHDSHLSVEQDVTEIPDDIR